ncbi:pectin acetylesterase 5-like [Solanum pennellii]|uniref:Pectin acetylesterase n=1 Tax=Solanum pennellii TaxID=28526 RepID=A0ABM1HRD7_SOLPN|nr:pectin acetylesterase 5-like [Solanum pennellii]XP_015089242.1 pectin acetylesterase 5-like [Solanum pennellii]XP_015089243.1 pectin acetylesterase 5-like [Solanum pennellii]
MANHRFQFLKWWRKLTRREWTIAAASLAILVLTLSFISHSNNSAIPANDLMIPFTPLSNAQQKSAFCLDGSLPGYHLQKGFGSGSDKWVLHIEGGGWCNSIETCSFRQTTKLGSSRFMEHEVQFFGILSSDPSQNPDFFDWNKVKIRYCDGGSFSGHPDSEFKNGTEFYFRGQVIWEAVTDELLSIGLSYAKKALLSGCSAGGLATLIHCDDFREILPKDANVKCLVDAGFFLNDKDVAGSPTIERFYQDVVNLQGVAKSLKKDCTSRLEPYKCFFPQEFISSIKTPVFLVQPGYDFWQIQNILVPRSSDPHQSWFRCKLNINNCNSKQLEVLQDFRNSLLKTLDGFHKNPEGGMFINSCFIHCQTWVTETWHSPRSPKINNKTIAEAVGDWYFNREEAKHIDCPFPCNPTCYHMNFTQG